MIQIVSQHTIKKMSRKCHNHRPQLPMSPKEKAYENEYSIISLVLRCKSVCLGSKSQTCHSVGLLPVVREKIIISHHPHPQLSSITSEGYEDLTWIISPNNTDDALQGCDLMKIYTVNSWTECVGRMSSFGLDDSRLMLEIRRIIILIPQNLLFVDFHQDLHVMLNSCVLYQ